MSVTTPTKYNPGTRGIVTGLIALGGLVAFSVIVAIAVLGTMFATGTLRHTDQGWVFKGTVSSAELKSQQFEAKTYTLLVQSGSGSSQTRQLTAGGSWTADWAYSCPSNSSSFRVVAHGQAGDYPAGDLYRAGSGAGTSNALPAGTYSLQVTTDPSCNWSVGARPSH